MVGRLVEQGKVWVDQPAVVMLLSPGFPGDQQQRQPDEQQQPYGKQPDKQQPNNEKPDDEQPYDK